MQQTPFTRAVMFGGTLAFFIAISASALSGRYLWALALTLLFLALGLVHARMVDALNRVDWEWAGGSLPDFSLMPRTSRDVSGEDALVAERLYRRATEIARAWKSKRGARSVLAVGAASLGLLLAGWAWPYWPKIRSRKR